MSKQRDEFHKTIVDRNIELAFELTESVIADPSLLADVPSGAMLVLIPDDDRELAEANLEGAVKAFRRGKNVYLCHVPGTRLPEPSESAVSRAS